MSDWTEGWRKQRIIHLVSDIDQNLSSQAIQQMWGFAAFSDEPVTLWLNTPGGNVHDALALIDAITACPVPIRTLGVGKIFSAGFLIFLAGTDRWALRNSLFMSHNFSTQGGPWHNIKTVSEWLTERLTAYLLARTSIQTVEEITDLFLSSEYWFDAEEAVRLGVAQRVVTEKLEVRRVKSEG